MTVFHMETSSDVIFVLDFSSVFTDDFLLVVFVFTFNCFHSLCQSFQLLHNEQLTKFRTAVKSCDSQPRCPPVLSKQSADVLVVKSDVMKN